MRRAHQVDFGDDLRGDDVEAHADNQSAQIIQIDASKHMAVMVLCAVVCGMSMAISTVALMVAWNSQTEARMVEYYLNDPSFRTPEELSAWNKFRQEHQ